MKAMLREGETFIIPICTMSQNFKTHRYQYLQEIIQRHCIQIHDSWPPPDHEGEKISEFKNKKCQESCNFATSNARMPPI